jgi:hypothetical protein
MAWHDWVLTGTSPCSSVLLRSAHAAPRPSQVGAGRWAVGASQAICCSALHHGATYIQGYSRGCSRGCSRGTHGQRIGRSTGRAVHGGPSRHGVPCVAWDISRCGTCEDSTGTHRGLRTPPSTECKSRAQLRVFRADHGCCLVSDYRTSAVRLCACAAPTPAPTNPGDTNPPTRAPTTSAPTYAPNFADPTGKSDAKPSAPLPPQVAQCTYGVASGTRYYCEMPMPRLGGGSIVRNSESTRTGEYPRAALARV